MKRQKESMKFFAVIKTDEKVAQMYYKYSRSSYKFNTEILPLAI